MSLYIEKPEVGQKPPSGFPTPRASIPFIREDEPYRWTCSVFNGLVTSVKEFTVIPPFDSVTINGKVTKLGDEEFVKALRRPSTVEVCGHKMTSDTFRKLISGYRRGDFFMPSSYRKMFQVEDGHLVAYGRTLAGKKIVGNGSISNSIPDCKEATFNAYFKTDERGYITQLKISTTKDDGFLASLIPGLETEGDYDLDGTKIVEAYEEVEFRYRVYRVPTINMENREKLVRSIAEAELNEFKEKLEESLRAAFKYRTSR